MSVLTRKLQLNIVLSPMYERYYDDDMELQYYACGYIIMNYSIVFVILLKSCKYEEKHVRIINNVFPTNSPVINSSLSLKVTVAEISILF